MTKAQLLYVEPTVTLPGREVLTPEKRLALWREQGAYTEATPEVIASYTPERLAALFKEAKGTKGLACLYWEFGGNGPTEPTPAGLETDDLT